MQTHITKTPSNYAEPLEHKPPQQQQKQRAASLWGALVTSEEEDLCTVTSFKFRLNFQSNPFSQRMWGEIPFCSALAVKCQTVLKTVSSRSLSVCLTARHCLNTSWGAAVNCLALIHHWFSIEVWLASIASLIQLWCGHVALFSFDLIQSVSGGHAVWPPLQHTPHTYTHRLWNPSLSHTHTSSHSHTS